MAEAEAPRCADCGEPLDSWRRKQVVREGKLVAIHTACVKKLVAPHGPYFKMNWDYYGPPGS